jgi:hypothetical protein
MLRFSKRLTPWLTACWLFLNTLLPKNRPVDNPAFGKCKKIVKKN